MRNLRSHSLMASEVLIVGATCERSVDQVERE